MLRLVTGSGSYPEPVDERSLWEGRTLRQWLPVAVQDVVRAAAPRRIVLFGSVARGDEGPDSDLDLLVVFDRIDPADRTRRIRSPPRLAAFLATSRPRRR